MVDNFIIRYVNEDTMRNWYKDIDAQRTIQAERRTLRNTGTSDSEFTYMEGMANIPNPYQQEYDTDDANGKDSYHSEFPMSRNASSTSLRTRSATGGSTGSVHPNGRPRYTGTDPTLSVHTQFSGSGNMSPSDRNASSYFSPTETPSTRSSSQSAGFTFSRQNTNSTTPSTAWSEESVRYTAPALSRVASREGSTSGGYFPAQPNGRSAQRPSLPPLSGSQAHSANGMAQRMRSASSPDIHHHNTNPEARRYMGVHTMQTVDNVPVPPIPAHMANMKAPVNRSQNGSPTNTQLPIRVQPQLHTTHFNEPEYNETRNSGQISDHATSPLTQEPEEGDPYMPTQLKAKVNFEDNYVTLVIATNILFRSLIDRVDAKLARFTDRSIGNKSVRLRYRDEDGDFVTIDSDEAVQLAFMEWREQHRDMLAKGLVGEIQLYCQVVD